MAGPGSTSAGPNRGWRLPWSRGRPPAPPEQSIAGAPSLRDRRRKLRFWGTAEMHETGPVRDAIFAKLTKREQEHVGADTGIGVRIKIVRAADVRGGISCVWSAHGGDGFDLDQQVLLHQLIDSDALQLLTGDQ